MTGNIRSSRATSSPSRRASSPSPTSPPTGRSIRRGSSRAKTSNVTSQTTWSRWWWRGARKAKTKAPTGWWRKTKLDRAPAPSTSAFCVSLFKTIILISTCLQIFCCICMFFYTSIALLFILLWFLFSLKHSAKLFFKSFLPKIYKLCKTNDLQIKVKTT